MILESHSDDLLFHFATDIGIYYINLNKNNVNKDEEEMNYNEAFKWFEKAFNIRHSKATINNYGICFLMGIGVQKDIEKAKEIFNLGVNIEDPNSMYHMGFILENTDPIKSFDLYKKAANKGNLFAKLHCLFISGSQNKEQSIEIYKKAAGLGDVKSQQILAKKYSIENDEENTFKYMKMLTSSGSYGIPLEYSIILYKMKKYKQAFNYFSLLSKYNHPIAMYFIGIMKFNGFGCSKNKEEAYGILQNLASNGLECASDFIDDNFI